MAFTTDVRPLLTKLGCNSGGCHGKATGQNGFKLSLLGFEPADDYESLVREARGPAALPRRARAEPAAAQGHRDRAARRRPAAGADSEDYQVLRRWIEQGAPPPRPDDPVVKRLDIEPVDAVLSRNRRVSLRVRASLSDGSTRDVTRLALYESNEPDVAEVSAAGEIRTRDRGGLFAVMVRYGDRFGVFHGTVPYRRRDRPATDSRKRIRAGRGSIGCCESSGDAWGSSRRRAADDATFLRRASLDIRGTMPDARGSPRLSRRQRPDKRARLIDRLLESPGYASLFGLKWADILKNRGGGYSTSRQRAGTSLFAGWIREAIASNMPYDRFATEILTAVGSQEMNPPTVWYRSVRTPQDYVESISQAFLGVRVQCAQCHHHPAERWSQDDYYGLAAVFARVGRKGGFADAEVPTNQTIFVASEGRVENPRTRRSMTPRPLGGPDFSVSPFDDPRASLARWMTDPTNPFFARTMANRIWGHFFGRGLIHPIDDARSTNPPSHPELLDALARDFVRSGYDVKHLIRVCCNSEAYALSAEPNAANREDHQTFARYYPQAASGRGAAGCVQRRPRRSDRLLRGPRQVPGRDPGDRPAGRGGAQLASSTCSAVRARLRVRMRAGGRGVAGPGARADRLADPGTEAEGEGRAAGSPGEHPRPVAEVVDDLFVRILGRPARSGEIEKARRFLEAQPDRREAFESLAWSLLASAEFLFNH